MNTDLDRFVSNVWPKVKEFLSKHWLHKHEGYVGREKGWGWHGPFIWSEDGDLKRIITRCCEDEFGFESVHNESKISQMAFKSWNGGHKSIDIDVTDAQHCKTAAEFRSMTHGLFIEVKMFQKGSNAGDKAIARYLHDCKKLWEEVTHVKPRCRAAVAVLVDEGDLDGKSYVTSWEEKTKQSLEAETAKYAPVVPLVWRIGA